MSPQLPDGVLWPRDGHLDPQLVGKPSKNLALYIHVPFCTVRCGYCDFNTYTVGFGQGADRDSYHHSVRKEVKLAADRLRLFDHEPVKSIFFGGGTPTLLRAGQIGQILQDVKDNFVLDQSAEVTVEANPDTIDQAGLEQLARAGVTRVSFGMQSAALHVLRTLDRSHTPQQVPRVVKWAREAGLDASVDLIYGTPGESITDWKTSLEAAIELQPDHISCYALVIEEGTKMWAQVRRGELATPDPDDEAEKYELADSLLEQAGYAWYEISNWAKLEDDEVAGSTNLRHASRHNLAYWFDWDWWGIGPGAHSHVGDVRWWNRKHPRAWADALAGGSAKLGGRPAGMHDVFPGLDTGAASSSLVPLASPAQAGEILDDSDRALEAVMLRIRTADGIPISSVSPQISGRVPTLLNEGLIEEAAAAAGIVKLTLTGRLLADYVTRELTV
ncbi:radical SAM family heme chaperone HemW [Actinomyces urinae]|uniref:radical SAM family heme chaperone HemW n=1 Tax=Actinomyces urinae TaxID=1689268 RepID=UPI000931D4E9|nr:radical SAM family heme chaperone HemW [Actinomyces urinae]